MSAIENIKNVKYRIEVYKTTKILVGYHMQRENKNAMKRQQKWLMNEKKIKGDWSRFFVKLNHVKQNKINSNQVISKIRKRNYIEYIIKIS